MIKGVPSPRQITRGADIQARTHQDIAQLLSDLTQSRVGGLSTLQQTNIFTYSIVEFVSFPAGELDYMNCQVPGTTAAIEIAKPYGLRPSLTSHGGVTFTYSTDTDRQADGTEDQVIVPAYDVGDEIIVFGPLDTGVLNAASDTIFWFDTNMGWGRNWAAVPV